MNQSIRQEMADSDFRLPLYYVAAVWAFCLLLMAITGSMALQFSELSMTARFVSIGGQLLWIAVILSIFRKYYCNWVAAAALAKPKTNLRFWGRLLGYVVLLRASLFLLPVSAEDLQWMEQHSANAPLLLVFLGTVILAPMAEELFYRQFLWQALQRQWQRPWLTIVLTSAAWALVHGQYTWVGLLHIFLFGLLLGWSRHQSASLWVPIGLHSLNNGLSFALLTSGWGS